MSEWSNYISLLIPHSDGKKILLVADGDEWTLPHFQLTAMYSNLHLLQRMVRERLGAEVTVLRWIHNHEDEAQQTVAGLWLMELHTPDWTPPEDAKWVEIDTLANIPLSDEILRSYLLQTVATLNAPDPVERVPWMRRGWFAIAQRWMTETLRTQGYELKAPPEQFKNFNLSALLRAETTTDAVYFKVANQFPLFCHEPKTTFTLGTLFPEYIPKPIAIDEARRWMLTPDIGNSLRDEQPNIETLQLIARTYARFQIGTASMLGTLMESGCLDRRLNVLAAQIDDLMADEASIVGMNDEEKAKWRAIAPTLKSLCAKLAEYKIPYTLVHGDFHAGNITQQGDKTIFFDWTDACIAHPFFDLPIFIDFDAADHEADLCDAYLACWTDYEPMERLLEVYQIAEILGALHQAVSYQGIRLHSEPYYRNQWDWAVPHFARLIFKKLGNL
jgi:hypothetical protein